MLITVPVEKIKAPLEGIYGEQTYPKYILEIFSDAVLLRSKRSQRE